MLPKRKHSFKCPHIPLLSSELYTTEKSWILWFKKDNFNCPNIPFSLNELCTTERSWILWFKNNTKSYGVYFHAGFTGVLLVLCVCIIYVYATQTARRFIFNGFWMTHKLIVVLYILTILHGASAVVQKPMFFAYFLGPAFLFVIDKMISLSRKKTELAVIKAEKLPSGINFFYASLIQIY